MPQLDMIEAIGLTKAYGETQALAGVDLTVPAGSILGMLGPNGAGKTTAVRILTTLATPDSGRAMVAGHDILTEPNEVRRHIGVAAQDATLDGALTGRQNLALIGELSRLGRSASRERARELLERFELTFAADRVLKGYSGGMRRRLDLAASLMTRPPVLFLDEPTTGLDPQARHLLWDRLYRLKQEGVTQVITTHYMDEAEQLCDRVAIMDHGKVIALGTPRELITSIGVEHMVEFSAGGAAKALEIPALRRMDGVRDVRTENGTVRMQVTELHRAVPALLEELERQGVPLTELRTHSATLEDVFVTLTGRHLRDE